jgi:hypothetical protein
MPQIVEPHPPQLGLSPDRLPGPLREAPQGLAVGQAEERAADDAQARQGPLERGHQRQVVYPVSLLVPAPDLVGPHPELLGLELEDRCPGQKPHRAGRTRPATLEVEEFAAIRPEDDEDEDAAEGEDGNETLPRPTDSYDKTRVV